MICGAKLRNGRSPARKRKLNEKMLRSSEAEMPMPPLGAGNYPADNFRGDKTMQDMRSRLVVSD